MKTKFFNVLGIIISTIIGVLPWVLVYVFGNKDFYFLNILIPFSLFIGYKLLKKKMNKKMLFIISIITITITTFIIIPVLLLLKEYSYISLANIILLYKIKVFSYNLIISFIASLLFIILGIYFLNNYHNN